MSTLTTGKKYNFITKYATVLGGKYKNMLLEGVNLSSNLAAKYSDIVVRHATIQGIADVNDPIKDIKIENMNWLVFKSLDTGEYIVLSTDYIVTDSLVESGDDFKFIVRGISLVDVGVIRKALSELGFYDIEELP